MGRPESAFEGLKATSSPGSCLLYSHPRGIPDFPICGQSGNWGFPDSRFRPTRSRPGQTCQCKLPAECHSEVTVTVPARPRRVRGHAGPLPPRPCSDWPRTRTGGHGPTSNAGHLASPGCDPGWVRNTVAPLASRFPDCQVQVLLLLVLEYPVADVLPCGGFWKDLTELQRIGIAGRGLAAGGTDSR